MVVSSLALVIAVEWWLYTLVVDATKTEMMEEQVKLIEKARAEERELQEKANHELQKQIDAKAVIATDLAADLERLRRERPTRPALPQNTGNDKSCGTGQALCTDDKILLRTEFARADEIRIALIRCYSDYDSAREAVKAQ